MLSTFSSKFLFGGSNTRVSAGAEHETESTASKEYDLTPEILPALGARSHYRVKLRKFIISPFDRRHRSVHVLYLSMKSFLCIGGYLMLIFCLIVSLSSWTWQMGCSVWVWVGLSLRLVFSGWWDFGLLLGFWLDHVRSCWVRVVWCLVKLKTTIIHSVDSVFL